MEDYEIEIYDEKELNKKFPNIYKFCNKEKELTYFSQAVWINGEGLVVSFSSDDENTTEDFKFKNPTDEIDGNFYERDINGD